MELNSIGFLILMVKKVNKEKIFLFFLFQTISSIMIMLYIFNNSWVFEVDKNLLNQTIMVISIFIKIGMFPFHTWMVNMVKNFYWLILLILFSWQKIIPSLMIMKLTLMKNFKAVLIMCMIITSLIMLKTTKSKLMLFLSSLIHNSWFLLMFNSFKVMVIFYLTIYSMAITPLIKSIKKTLSSSVIMMINSKKDKGEKMNMMMILAGTPPSMGFMVKMTVLISLIMVKEQKSMITMLFIASCLSFYVYFQILFKNLSNYLYSTKKKTILNKLNKNKVSWVFVLPSTLMIL